VLRPAESGCNPARGAPPGPLAPGPGTPDGSILPVVSTFDRPGPEPETTWPMLDVPLF